MTTSPQFGLPWVATAQAQPEVTHNAALLLLQAMFGGVKGQQNAPPGSPAAGDAWLVGAAGSGAWNGRNNKVAIYDGTSWMFVPGFTTAGANIPIGAAHEGLRVYRQDTDVLVVWTGAAWATLAP